MSVCLTMLMENRAKKGLASEHGFAVLIEKDGCRVLLDSGQTGAFLDNAEKLSVQLNPLEAFVLSHGHYDHAGGIPRLLTDLPNTDMYMAPGYERERYSLKSGKPSKYIGIREETRLYLQRNGERIHLCEKPTEILSGLYATGPIPRRNDYEDVGGPFFGDEGGLQPDAIEDDQALWIETDKGLLIITGCAHAGIINTVAYAREQSGMDRVYGILGGFHLVNANEIRLQQTMEALHEINPAFLAPCHCTGDKALEILKTEFSAAFHDARAGSGFSFPLPSIQRRANIGD